MRGETVRQTFAIATSTLRLTVIDADGKPVPDLAIVSRPANDQLPPTDAAGHLEVELTTETITLQVLPRRLRSPEAQLDVLAKASANGSPDADPFAADWLTIGTVALQQGQPHTLTLRLPPDQPR